jgi:hypothetical protein
MIERWQARKLNDSIGPSVNYLRRLLIRLEKTGKHSGKLYELARKAHMAVFDLSNELHYLSCEGGVYRERKQ